MRSLTSRDRGHRDQMFNNPHLIAVLLKSKFGVVGISVKFLFLASLLFPLGLIASLKWSGRGTDSLYRVVGG